MSTQEELEARIAAAKARQAAISDAQTTAAIAAAQAVEAKDQAYSLLDNTLQADKENTFTAAQTFQAPVTVGTPRVPAVWAFKEIGISDANMRKAGTISDNDGHTLEIPEDATRTQNQFAALVEASELGLKVTHIGTTYRFYDVASPAGQEGTIGNTRRLYVDGIGWTSRQTWALAGGKDGVEEVGHPMMLNGNVYIGHGPEGVKARCYFDVNTAYMTKAGTLTDNNPNHPLAIELPEDPARTIDSCIAEINAQGEKLEVKAIKRNGSSIYLESTVEGSVPNGIVFTRTGCFSTTAAGTAQTTTQGTNILGLDEGAASEWELRQNGYPVASRHTNNVYEGVQVFNNAVALNGAVTLNGSVTGSGIRDYNANLLVNMARSYIIDTDIYVEPLANIILNPGPILAVFAPSWKAHSDYAGAINKWAAGRSSVVGMFKNLEVSNHWPGWSRVDIVIAGDGNLTGHGWVRDFRNIDFLHLIMPEKTGLASNYAFAAATTYGDLLFYAPKMKTMRYAFTRTTAATRKAKFYLPALAESRELLPEARLDKDSLVYTIDSLTKYTNIKYTLTIGRDNSMSDEDKAVVQSHADAKYDAETDTGWVVVFNDN